MYIYIYFINDISEHTFLYPTSFQIIIQIIISQLVIFLIMTCTVFRGLANIMMSDFIAWQELSKIFSGEGHVIEAQ